MPLIVSCNTKETFNILVRMQWHYVRDVCVCVCVFLSVGLNLRPCHTSRTLPRPRCTCEWKSTPTGCSLPAILQSVHRRLDATPTYWMNEWMNKWECRSLTCSQKPTGSQCQTKRLMGKLERKRNRSAVHSPWRQSDGCGGGLVVRWNWTHLAVELIPLTDMANSNRWHYFVFSDIGSKVSNNNNMQINRQLWIN